MHDATLVPCDHTDAPQDYYVGMKEMDIFVANLLALLERRRWSVNELDKRSGVSRTQIGLVLKGERQITVLRAAMIAHAFGLTLDEMLRQDLPSEERAEEGQLASLYRRASPGARQALMDIARQLVPEDNGEAGQ